MSSDKKIDEKGLQAARRYAGWELGDPAWADAIIRAYLNPDDTNAKLDTEDVPEQTGVWRRSW